MTRRPVLWLPPILLSAAVAACASDIDDRPGATVVTDSAGVEIVTNGSFGSLGVLEAHEILRLGVVDGGGPQQFSQVLAVALGADGQIIVGNNGSSTVRLFDRDGGFVTEFGGRGGGPAEVSMVNDVFATGDTIAMIDWQRGGKVVLFDSEGAFLMNWSVRQPDGTRLLPLARDSAGWLVSVYNSSQRPTLAAGEAWTFTQDVYAMTLESPEVGGAPVYSIPGYTLYGMPGEAEGGADWSLFRTRVYSGFDAAGHLYVTDPQSYRIDIHTPLGFQRSVRKSFQPRQLTDQDVEDLKAAAMQVVDTLSRIPDQMRPQQRRQIEERIDKQARLPLPQIVTPLGQILVAADGSFWVNVVDTSKPAETEAGGMFGLFGEFPPDTTVWDLFDRRGLYLGSVTLPRRFRAEAVTGMEVVGVWADDLDVEYVVKFRAAPTQGN